ncbi:hypothetical protein DL96DRAFT_279487 [Flagelloscypha sp. PMI_526]|nr:hypothetical protein DL96DRAFT_279487 [Flagelloscypha sp. PMI_526]
MGSFYRGQRLPVELECLVFEEAAKRYPLMYTPLRLVARRVNKWIIPIQFEEVYFSDFGGASRVEFFLTWGNGYLTHVRRVFCCSEDEDESETVPLQVLSVLREMHNLRHLAFWYEFDEGHAIAHTILELSLTRLSTSVDDAFIHLTSHIRRSPTRKYPLTTTLTHLELSMGAFPPAEELRLFPVLTHIAISWVQSDEVTDQDDEAEREAICDSAVPVLPITELQVLAICHASPIRAEKLVPTLNARGINDPRVVSVYVENDHADWYSFCVDGNDLWHRADAAVTENRARLAKGKEQSM